MPCPGQGPSPSLEPRGRNALEGDPHREDAAGRVEMEPFDAHDAVVAVGGAQRVPMIDDVVLVLASAADDGVVSGPRGDGRVGLQDRPFPLEGAEGAVGAGVGHVVVGAGPATLTPHKVVSPVSLEHERTLHIALRRHFLVDAPVLEGDEAHQVVTQLHQVAMPPAAVVHIVRPVVIQEDELVDGLRPVHDLVHERMPEGVLERAGGVVSHGDADAALPFLVHVVRPEKEVVLPVLPDHGRRPARKCCPWPALCHVWSNAPGPSKRTRP